MRTQVFLNIHSIIAAAWRRRYVIVMPILLLPILALVVGAMTPKKYQSHTTMLIQETTKLNPFLADFAVSTQLKERMAALKALLHSRHMLTEVALELGYINQANDKDAQKHIKRLSRSLSVNLIGSDMIKLNMASDDPDSMEQILNVVSKHFLSNLLAPERSSIDASETFLQSQLYEQQRSLVAAESKLALFKTENSARLPDQYSFDVLQLRGAEKELRIKNTELAGAKAKLSSLNTQLLKTNPMLASVEEAISRKSSELALLKSRYFDRHSAVIGAQKELDQLRGERALMIEVAGSYDESDIESLWQLATISKGNEEAGTRPLLVSQMEAVELAKSEERQLQEEISQLNHVVERLSQKIESFASVEQQMKELERDIHTKQTIYHDLLKRHEMAKVTGALGRFEEQERVKVIDRPFTPYAPVNMPLFVYGLLGIFGGLFLGAALALLLEVSDSSVVRRDAVEKLTGLPVITRIPKVI